MNRVRGATVLRFATVLLISAPAAVNACTVCDSALGQQVRNGIFTSSFGATLLAVVAPFPILLIAVAAARLVVPNDVSQHAARPPE